MDSLHAALDLAPVSAVDIHLLQLGPDLAATARALLRHTPLIVLLTDLHNLSHDRLEERQREALKGIAKCAIERHDYTRNLFMNLAQAVAAPSLERATDCLRDLPVGDASLAFEMLAFASDLLVDAQLPEKAAFTFDIALSVADRFQLLKSRAIILHTRGFFEQRRGRLEAAEDALREASSLFALTHKALVPMNNLIRAQIFVQRLRLEDNPPPPDDFEALIASDADIAGLVLPVLASKAVERDDFKAAESLIMQLRSMPGNATSPHAALLLVEARLARRLGRFESAQTLLAQVEKADDAASLRVDVLREKLYFARDFNKPEDAAHIRAELEQLLPPVTLLYNDAIFCLQKGDVDEAKKLFLDCLSLPIDDTMRASCHGMLGQLGTSAPERKRNLYFAIGLFLKLGRKLDHAIALSQLAAMELQDAAARKHLGHPLDIIDEFNRADQLLQAVQELIDVLGARTQLETLSADRARLEWMRGRHRAALRYYDAAMKFVERDYLALSDRRQAEHFFSQKAGLYNQAVACAAEADRPRDALLFTERGKARLLLRDAAELAFEHGVVSEKERPLLAAIRPLRSRLVQGRPLSAQERRTLHDAEERLAAERADMVNGQALEWDELRTKIFGTHAPPASDEPDEHPRRPSLQTQLACPRCMAYNPRGASFCSACELRTASTSREDVQTGGDSPAGASLADKWRTISLNQLANRARDQHDFFSAGLSCLRAGDTKNALIAFRRNRLVQFTGSYPFWTLPVSPGELDRAIDRLEDHPGSTRQVLEDLMETSARGDTTEAADE